MQLYNRKINKVRLPRLQKTQVILYFAGRSRVGMQLMIPHACQLPHPRSGHCVHKPRLVCCITSLPPKTHMTPVASRSQQHGQSHQLPHSAATCASPAIHDQSTPLRLRTPNHVDRSERRSKRDSI